MVRRATPEPTRSAMAAVLQSKPLADEMTTAESELKLDCDCLVRWTIITIPRFPLS